MPVHPQATRFALQSLTALTAEDEQALASRRIAGDASARETLVLANISFAMGKAQYFRHCCYSRHLDDLKSIAIIGLIDAADRYKPGIMARGKIVRFTTYASHWIKARLELATTEEIATIRIPRWTVDAMRLQDKGEPIPEKLDNRESRESIEKARQVMGFEAFGRTRAGLAAGVLRNDVYSIDEAYSPNTLEPLEVLARAERDPHLARALARLSRDHPLDYRIINLVNPLDGSEGLNFTETAKVIGRDRNRVGEYYKRGLAKLREYIEVYRKSFEMRESERVA